MQQPSLDDQIKQSSLDKATAEITKLRSETAAIEQQTEKARAETEKLRSETAALRGEKSSERLTEHVKLFAAVILGIGGAVAAWTQYQVAEYRAEAAKVAKATAEAGRDAAQSSAKLATDRQHEAESKTASAVKLATESERKRDQLEKEATIASARASEAEKHLREAQSATETAVSERKRLMVEIGALNKDLDRTKVKLTEAKSDTTEARAKLDQGVLDGLRPAAKDLAIALQKRAHEEGIEVGLVVGFRSAEQQLALYNQGRTTPGNIVTNARVTVHNTGLAFDIAILKDGVLRYDDATALEKVGAIGKNLGLVWGGDYHVARDPMHFETVDAKQALKELLAHHEQ